MAHNTLEISSKKRQLQSKEEIENKKKIRFEDSKKTPEESKDHRHKKKKIKCKSSEEDAAERSGHEAKKIQLRLEEENEKGIGAEDIKKTAAHRHSTHRKNRDHEDLKKTKRSRSPDEDIAGPTEQKKPRIEAPRPPHLDIKNYTFHTQLGSGGYGRVMLASLPGKDKPVAVKIIAKKQNEKDQAILKEVCIMKLATKCAFICPAFAAFQSQVQAFIVMEHASGGTLLKQIRSQGNLTQRRILFYSAEMVVGLQFLHANGIIHRDFKPDNVLLDDEGHVKICDFGLSLENMFGPKTHSGGAGTFGFQAPEVMSQMDYNTGADWWSFGVTLYEMATGYLPYSAKGNTKEQLHQVLQRQPYYPSYLCPELQDLLCKLLKNEPDQRLGVNGNIREHPFFACLDWEEVEQRRLEPPFKPKVRPIEYYGEKKIEFPTGDSSESRMLEDFSFLDPNWQE
ncbi:protein kinase C delta type-like [Xenopus laevis]|uniref:Protein kinase C delta type-like n=1 Tax=Xenopus laevis TaxID=8355 RepID=A0A8J1MBB2_XENLA|nr:protein kinase C delta type-like [Xenopus laevis]